MERTISYGNKQVEMFGNDSYGYTTKTTFKDGSHVVEVDTNTPLRKGRIDHYASEGEGLNERRISVKKYREAIEKGYFTR